jgi:methylglutaconyl-CoA hydratase
MKFLDLKETDGIATVELNRPDVRNAFNPEMIGEITKTFLGFSQSTRAVILKGSGSVFCAGADLSWMQDMVKYSFQENVEDSKKLHAMFASVRDCAAPVITAVQGAAFGGALGLIACSDFVVIEEKTQLCFSEVKLGIAPAAISDFILEKIPAGLVAPWMISGQVFGETQALQMGLVHQCVASSSFTAAQKIAQAFQACGPEAVAVTKKLIRDLNILEGADRKDLVCKTIAERRASAEGQEGMKAFLEKRSPIWKKGTSK